MTTYDPSTGDVLDVQKLDPKAFEQPTPDTAGMPVVRKPVPSTDKVPGGLKLAPSMVSEPEGAPAGPAGRAGIKPPPRNPLRPKPATEGAVKAEKAPQEVQTNLERVEAQVGALPGPARELAAKMLGEGKQIDEVIALIREAMNQQ